VILLVDVEGLSYEEAGQALDVPVGTIRSRLHRARSLLLNLLRPRVAMDSKDGRGSA
jgi:RNA polymerase sigma-70 factor (ECF subfamily)